jgi:hypothetical protein
VPVPQGPARSDVVDSGDDVVAEVGAASDLRSAGVLGVANALSAVDAGVVDSARGALLVEHAARVNERTATSTDVDGTCRPR